MKYRKLKQYKYGLMEEHTYLTNIYDINIETPFISLRDGLLINRKGYAWDGASGPAIDSKDFMEGSLVHDSLYQLIREGYLPEDYRKYADEVLREICLESGMSKLRANYVYYAVRTFGGMYLNKGTKQDEIYEV